MTPQRIREYNPLPRTRHTLRLPSVREAFHAVKTMKIPDYRALWLPAATVVLAVMLIANLYAITKNGITERARADAQAALTTLENKLEEAKLAKVFNQPEKAIEGFQTVITGADALQNTPASDNAIRIRDEAQDQFDGLTSTTRLKDARHLAPLNDGSAIASWGSFVSAVGKDAALRTVNASGGESTDTSLSAPIADLGLQQESASLLALTMTPSILQIANPGVAPEALTATGGWKLGSAITSFFGNIYLLAPNDGQIWKYSPSEGVFGSAERYVADNTNLTNAIDLAIDGSVYVLENTGNVLKFTRGRAVEFRIRDIPKPSDTLAHATQIETTVDGDTVFVLDDQRIVAFDKTGRFQKQYAFLSEIGSLKRFTISKEGTTVYALTTTGIYAADL